MMLWNRKSQFAKLLPTHLLRQQVECFKKKGWLCKLAAFVKACQTHMMNLELVGDKLCTCVSLWAKMSAAEQSREQNTACIAAAIRIRSILFCKLVNKMAQE